MAVSPEQEKIIAEGLKNGLPRNEIARQAGVSGSVVSTRAKRAGVTFDRTATAAATTARTVDMAERRSILRAKALDTMEMFLDMALSGKHYQIVRTKEGDVVVPRDTPTAKDAADLSRAIQAAVMAEAKLAEQEKSSESAPIVEALTKMFNSTERLPGEE